MEGKYAIETWAYAGRRFMDGMYHRWENPDGGSHVFKAFKGRAVGGYYRVECVRSSLGASVRGEPRFDTGRRDERHPDTPQWVLDDKAAVIQQEASRAERRSGDRDALGGMTLAEFRHELAGKLPHQRRGMLLVLLDYMSA